MDCASLGCGSSFLGGPFCGSEGGWSVDKFEFLESGWLLLKVYVTTLVSSDSVP